MSIVHYLPEVPEDDTVVFAYDEKRGPDRAIYSGGEFTGGGDFPIRPYKMFSVSKWFYLDEYGENFPAASNGNKCYTVSFDQAYDMP